MQNFFNWVLFTHKLGVFDPFQPQKCRFTQPKESISAYLNANSLSYFIAHSWAETPGGIFTGLSILCNQPTSRALMHNASQLSTQLANPLKPLGPHLLTSLSLLLSFVLWCLESWMVNVTPLTPQQWRTHWLYNEGARLLGIKIKILIS